MKVFVRSMAVALLVFSLAFFPVAFGQEEEHQDPPPDPGGGSSCTYCSQNRCGCAAPETLSALLTEFRAERVRDSLSPLVGLPTTTDFPGPPRTTSRTNSSRMPIKLKHAEHAWR